MASHHVWNFGSLNLDKVYRVPHFVRPGETLAAESFRIFPGGKGLNQSIALARAGISVIHAGAIGKDGLYLRELLELDGVDCSFLAVKDEVQTGHAVIQVAVSGENCILLDGGANRSITEADAKEMLSHVRPGDWVLLQNEISALPVIIREAAAVGARIFFNPAPMGPEVDAYPLDVLDTLIVNETEGAALAHTDSADYRQVIPLLRERLPQVNLLMTLGAAGAVHCAGGSAETVFAPACRVEKVVDTTAAGDTFIGYFMAERLRGTGVAEAMGFAARASAWCVARAGAACSIPHRRDLVPSGVF